MCDKRTLPGSLDRIFTGQKNLVCEKKSHLCALECL